MTLITNLAFNFSMLHAEKQVLASNLLKFSSKSSTQVLSTQNILRNGYHFTWLMINNYVCMLFEIGSRTFHFHNNMDFSTLNKWFFNYNIFKMLEKPFHKILKYRMPIINYNQPIDPIILSVKLKQFQASVNQTWWHKKIRFQVIDEIFHESFFYKSVQANLIDWFRKP